MPFKRIKHNKYRGPSGKIFTKDQVIAYYAKKGWKSAVETIKKKYKKRKKVKK